MKNVEEIKQRMFDDLLLRFWRNINKTETCWLWTASVHNNGYGSITVLRKEIPVHRLSWMIHQGTIPEGYWVLHKCNNKRCVKPDHLYLGDVRDNVADAVRSNLFPKGEKHGLHVLTEEQVKEIRKEYRPRTTPMQKLADKYGVNTNVIFQIVHRITWKHI